MTSLLHAVGNERGGGVQGGEGGEAQTVKYKSMRGFQVKGNANLRTDHKVPEGS
jgi:hypothetical protein